ncbi:MAG: hypothetical protein ABSC06_32470 [Rhodopila sp.]|jgi:NADH:ubiquinone oxidoreductase subunit 2 (subunit N)
MGNEDMAILGPLILVAVSGVLLYVLSPELLTCLITWALVSVPIGVLVGHCVLSEE